MRDRRQPPEAFTCSRARKKGRSWACRGTVRDGSRKPRWRGRGRVHRTQPPPPRRERLGFPPPSLSCQRAPVQPSAVATTRGARREAGGGRAQRWAAHRGRQGGGVGPPQASVECSPDDCRVELDGAPPRLSAGLAPWRAHSRGAGGLPNRLTWHLSCARARRGVGADKPGRLRTACWWVARTVLALLWRLVFTGCARQGVGGCGEGVGTKYRRIMLGAQPATRHGACFGKRASCHRYQHAHALTRR